MYIHRYAVENADQYNYNIFREKRLLMKRLNILTLLLTIALGATLVSCNSKNNERSVYDPYSALRAPHYVGWYLKSGDTLSQTNFSIDQYNHKIFNVEPLPYLTELDSAYMELMVSYRSKVEVKNLTTNGVQMWNPSKAKEEKVEIKGGKLLLTIITEDEKSDVTYDVTFNVYTYDPNKLTWQKYASKLPVKSGDSKFIQHGDRLLLLMHNEVAGTEHLYVYDVANLKDMQVNEVAHLEGTVPEPHTITVDTHGLYYGLTSKGGLMVSKDLLNWKEVESNVTLTALLYDLNLDGENGAAQMIAVGHTGDMFNIYQLWGPTMKPLKLIEDEGFPVRGMKIYTYDVAGVRKANMIGGVDRHGNRVKKMYFTSDGMGWGSLRYGGDGFEAPRDGATLMEYKEKIYLVGGDYETADNAKKIYVSQNYGATWTEMSEDQGPSEAFEPRTGVAGVVVEEDGDAAFYLYGGAVNGKETSDIWRGYIKKN